MRLSHTELAACLANPRSWLASRRKAGGPRTLGYDQILKLGILRFHRAGGSDPEQAREHIRALLERLTDKTRKENVLRRFGEYVDWFAGSGLVVGGVRIRIALEASASLTLSGEVSRVDVVDVGYRGVLLGRHSADWKSEMRMPLLQLGLAEVLARPVQEVTIGVQDLDGGGLASTRFAERAIARAQVRLRGLAKTLAAETQS